MGKSRMRYISHGCQKFKRGQVTRMSGLYREDPLREEQSSAPAPQSGEFRIEAEVC